MDQCTKAVRLNGWRKVVEACSSMPDGMTVKEWLTENNIGEKAYYYWQRKIRQKAFDDARAALPSVKQETGVSFAELRINGSSLEHTDQELPIASFQPDVVIRTSSATIALSNTVSDRILSALLKGGVLC